MGVSLGFSTLFCDEPIYFFSVKLVLPPKLRPLHSTGMKIVNRLSVINALSLLIVVSACQPPEKGIDAEDERNPYFRRAAEYAANNEIASAIRQYEKALEANPEVYRAHEEIGLLYSERLQDPVSAIYHFQKYLNAPRADLPNRKQVETYIDKAKIDFALTLPNSPTFNAEQVAHIGKQNQELKKNLSELQSTIAQRDSEIASLKDKLQQMNLKTSPPTSTPPPSQEAPKTASTPKKAEEKVSEPSTASSPKKAIAVVEEIKEEPVSESESTPTPSSSSSPTSQRTYVIQKGDNLWNISKKFYPEDINEGIEKIKAANPEKTANVKTLKLGTTLIIP